MPAEYSAERLNAHFAAISKRFDQLERQVALLSEKAGVPYSAPTSEVPTSEVPKEVVDLVQAGKTVEAVKKYREITGASSDEARNVVGAL